ncbi:hypothetical protein SPRG_22088 [Saprolegnia parasitica CBS 223.65]|uniref:Transmembrane protein n=1 Tax=Saprolegnia parasitica (strain CBS 223.65) TaxID=695850 RepID=A0A067D3G4_SAPPC|nr:hypothetical protein SPRG_22088 [Saprolegnia parasitica CBS 223.65]KDO33562.1 hypothetical protein SPRG_22088 [Saprolegnia parasitica CBS 223.65]|eukprot:XP_012195766.1 hypothetical protein SPRG_22088 [Saprolegnia parasitica CBS 223.65]
MLLVGSSLLAVGGSNETHVRSHQLTTPVRSETPAPTYGTRPPTSSDDDDALYRCHELPRVCNPPSEHKADACRTLFPDCFRQPSIVVSTNASGPLDGRIPRCDRVQLLNALTAQPETQPCLAASNLSILSLLYGSRLERDQVRAFNRTAACRSFAAAFASAVAAIAPCSIKSHIVHGERYSGSHFEDFVERLLGYVNVAYTPSYDASPALAAMHKAYPSDALLHVGMDPSLGLGPFLLLLLEGVVVCLCVATLFWLVRRACEANPYATALYDATLREVAVVGVFSFLVQRCLLWEILPLESPTHHGLLIVQDVLWLVVLVHAAQTAVVSWRVFAAHHRRCAMAARSLPEFVAVATNGNFVTSDDRVPRRFREGVDFFLLRHLFLSAHALPTTFQFDVYLNHVEAATAVELLPLPWWSWPVLLAVYASFLGIADGVVHPSWSAATVDEMARLAPTVYRPDVAAARLYVLVVFVSVALLLTLAVAWYLYKVTSGLVLQACDIINELNMASKIESLQVLASRGDEGSVTAKDVVAALTSMEHLSESLMEAPEVLPSRLVQMPSWSRASLSLLVRLCMVLPVLFLAMLCDCLLLLASAPWWYRCALGSLLLVLAFLSTVLLPLVALQLGTVLGVASPDRHQVLNALSASILRVRERALQLKATSAATIVLSPTPQSCSTARC